MIVKPRYLKSINTINAEPSRMTSNIQHIMMLDIAGAAGGEIAKLTNLSESRVSIIRNTPMYVQARESKWKQLQASVIDKTSDQITNEEVRKAARAQVMPILKEWGIIALNDESSFAKIAAGRELIRVAGVVEERKQTRSAVIEIGDKWAERWDRVRNHDEHNHTKGACKISITEEVSS